MVVKIPCGQRNQHTYVIVLPPPSFPHIRPKSLQTNKHAEWSQIHDRLQVPNKNNRCTYLHEHESVEYLTLQRSGPAKQGWPNGYVLSRKSCNKADRGGWGAHLRMRLIWGGDNLASSMPHCTARRASRFSSLRLFLRDIAAASPASEGKGPAGRRALEWRRPDDAGAREDRRRAGLRERRNGRRSATAAAAAACAMASRLRL
jgi:hypothetical protein